jgi:hypothetical protein
MSVTNVMRFAPSNVLFATNNAIFATNIVNFVTKDAWKMTVRTLKTLKNTTFTLSAALSVQK